MFNTLTSLSPFIQTLLAGIFTWLMTLIGASISLFGRELRPKLCDSMLGAAGGVMIAASFWSLLTPALDLAQFTWSSRFAWIPVAIGFLLGAIVIRSLDWILPHLHPGLALEQVEGIHTHWRQSTLLFLAITLHNIPEGFAVGVAFGAFADGAVSGSPGGAMTLAGAWAVAVGIGLQNIPEGLAVAAPLRMSGLSRWKSFVIGQFSGLVEPIAAVVGFIAVTLVETILPYALAFAAGAMIFVVVEELIPRSHQNGNTDAASSGAILGFTLMMILDVALS